MQPQSTRELLAEVTVRRDLEPRLARRRAIEAQHHRGLNAHGHGDFALQHERILRWLLKTGLRLTGLYERGLANARRPVVRHLRLEFPRLPARLHGFQILHLSDFHIDGTDGLTEALAEQLPFLPVDLCVLTGDYRYEIRGTCDQVYPRMRRIVNSIRARHGVVGILGNHDCSEIAIGLENMGVRMLINESLAIGPAVNPLWVIGVDDPHYFGCDNLPEALRGVPGEEFKLLLAHSPEMFREASAAGIDLYLSGHTHGGQIRLPGIGPLIQLADCPRHYAYGSWRHDGMEGYTTAGAGCSLLPVRFGCPPEVVVIELAKA
ncbi:MAG: metallophosphoesterase [Acidobacteriia bacterium]|nr:metallophosphoesterase [Terriglobia bacterium]